jgi:outer membrane protein assembly factor BamE
MLDLFEKSVRRPLAMAGLLGVSLSLVACSGLKSATETLGNVGNIVTPYRIDIIQGNFVSREQAAALTPGMLKAQVRDVLGTPLLVSVFHADRWDYVFTFRRPGQPVQQRRVTAFFKGDVLERVEADELPSEAEFVSSLDTRKRAGKTPVLEASEESLKAFAAQRKAVDADASAAPVPPISNYPPLEPPSATNVR